MSLPEGQAIKPRPSHSQEFWTLLHWLAEGILLLALIPASWLVAPMFKPLSGCAATLAPLAIIFVSGSMFLIVMEWKCWRSWKARNAACQLLTPMPDNAQTTMLTDYAGRFNLDIKFRMMPSDEQESAPACAMTMVMKKERIVAFSPTLLSSLEPDELQAVLAHELGHLVNADHVRREVTALLLFVILIVLMCVPTLIAQANSSAADIVSLVPIYLVALWIYAKFCRIVSLACSRRFERQANTWAMRHLDDPRQLLNAYQKLAEINHTPQAESLIDKLLFQTHPTLADAQRQVLDFLTSEKAKEKVAGDSQ
jgi:Zn-dependent protease with chaperone function